MWSKPVQLLLKLSCNASPRLHERIKVVAMPIDGLKGIHTKQHWCVHKSLCFVKGIFKGKTLIIKILKGLLVVTLTGMHHFLLKQYYRTVTVWYCSLKMKLLLSIRKHSNICEYCMHWSGHLGLVAEEHLHVFKLDRCYSIVGAILSSAHMHTSE